MIGVDTNCVECGVSMRSCTLPALCFECDLRLKALQKSFDTKQPDKTEDLHTGSIFPPEKSPHDGPMKEGCKMTQSVLIRCPCCAEILEIKISAAGMPVEPVTKLEGTSEAYKKALDDAAKRAQEMRDSLRQTKQFDSNLVIGKEIAEALNHHKSLTGWDGEAFKKAVQNDKQAEEEDWIYYRTGQLKKLLGDCNCRSCSQYPCTNCKKNDEENTRLANRMKEINQGKKELPTPVVCAEIGLKELPKQDPNLDCAGNHGGPHCYKTTHFGGICDQCGRVVITHKIRCERGHNWAKQPGTLNGCYCVKCGKTGEA